jgi:fumarate reductase subunit C
MYAIHGGLTTALILGRTQGSFVFGTYYSLFVIVTAVHASIGMRNVLLEWTSMNRRAVAWGVLLLGVFLTVTGLRAVAAVIL